jgi:hypothetical protein
VQPAPRASFDVELLGDVGLLADQARDVHEVGQLVAERQEADALLRVVRDPVAALGQLRELRAELFERRERVVEAPDEDARDQKGPRAS